MAQGVKGNKHNSPTAKEINSQARAHGPNALKVLHGIASSTKAPPAARAAAANSILDRGFGKPSQSVSIDHQVTITAIERRIVDAIDVEAVEVIEHKPTESDT